MHWSLNQTNEDKMSKVMPLSFIKNLMDNNLLHVVNSIDWNEYWKFRLGSEKRIENMMLTVSTENDLGLSDADKELLLRQFKNWTNDNSSELLINCVEASPYVSYICISLKDGYYKFQEKVIHLDRIDTVDEWNSIDWTQFLNRDEPFGYFYPTEDQAKLLHGWHDETIHKKIKELSHNEHSCVGLYDRMYDGSLVVLVHTSYCDQPWFMEKYKKTSEGEMDTDTAESKDIVVETDKMLEYTMDNTHRKEKYILLSENVDMWNNSRDWECTCETFDSSELAIQAAKDYIINDLDMRSEGDEIKYAVAKITSIVEGKVPEKDYDIKVHSQFIAANQNVASDAAIAA